MVANAVCAALSTLRIGSSLMRVVVRCITLTMCALSGMMRCLGRSIRALDRKKSRLLCTKGLGKWTCVSTLLGVYG